MCSVTPAARIGSPLLKSDALIPPAMHKLKIGRVDECGSPWQAVELLNRWNQRLSRCRSGSMRVSRDQRSEIAQRGGRTCMIYQRKRRSDSDLRLAVTYLLALATSHPPHTRPRPRLKLSPLIRLAYARSSSSLLFARARLPAPYVCVSRSVTTGDARLQRHVDTCSTVQQRTAAALLPPRGNLFG